MMDILMSETCWARKKWNKIASDIKVVVHSSTITMMHGPINIRCIVFQFIRVQVSWLLLARWTSCHKCNYIVYTENKLTPPFFGKKTTFTNVGISRTSSLYRRSWSKTRMMSTSNAWATWVRCLYPSPFTHPHVLIIAPEAFASTKNYNNIKFWKQKIFQHLIYLPPMHTLPNFENAPIVNLFSQNVTFFHYWLLADYHWNFKRKLLQTLPKIP